MAQYKTYAKFYDATQGQFFAERYVDLIGRYHPSATSLLDVACGTGSALEIFAKDYDVAGLDLSPTMLEFARRRVPHASLYQQDMAGFRIDATFDVAICAYDSINHVLSFRDWQRTFAAVARHLNPRGVFIFDINTQYRLRELVAQPAGIQDFGNHTMITYVSDAGRGVTNWEIRVFEHARGAQFRLHREIIKETSFPAIRVREALLRRFRHVRVLDAQGWSRPKRMSRRLYFVAVRPLRKYPRSS